MVKKESYGIREDEEVTTIKARDAIINCFFQAHKSVLDKMKDCTTCMNEDEFKNIEQTDIKQTIKKMFNEIDADFDNPTKKDLILVCDKLEEFSKHFRDEKEIHDHKSEIMQIIQRIKDG